MIGPEVPEKRGHNFPPGHFNLSNNTVLTGLMPHTVRLIVWLATNRWPPWCTRYPKDGHRRSLYSFVQALRDADTADVIGALKCTTSLNGRLQLLSMLLKREGFAFEFDGTTVRERLKSLLSTASTLRYWCVVRECTALLGKEVESLSPYITTVLVSGKQVRGRSQILIRARGRGVTPERMERV